ncbi:MAG: hypothetical protein ACK45B_14965 [Limisphaerales bacterium]
MPMTRRAKKVFWILAVLAAVGGLATVLWVRKFGRYTPIEAVLDLQAAAKVRHSPQPVWDFMEARYGPMTDPANRQRAFLDFFNPGHIEGLHMIVNRAPPEEAQAHIQAMADFIARYRREMTPAERAALGAHFRTQSGQAALQRATTKFLNTDVRFRASTSRVIAELMTTVDSVRHY